MARSTASSSASSIPPGTAAGALAATASHCCRPDRFSRRRVVEEVVQERVRGLGEQALALLEEPRVVLRLPQLLVHRESTVTRARRGDAASISGEVLGRRPVADLKVRVLRQEAEVRDGVDLRLLEALAVQQRLGEDVMHLECIHAAQQRCA